MTLVSRLLGLFVAALGLFLAVLLWVAVRDYGTALAWAGAVSVSLFVLSLAPFLVADWHGEKGRAEAEWTSAGYRRVRYQLTDREGRPLLWHWRFLFLSGDRPQTETVREWIGLDGDGEVDPGELRPGPKINRWDEIDKVPDPAAVAAAEDRLRALLIWCYRCEAGKADWGQIAGRAVWGVQYDEDANELARRDYIRGRSTGHQGKLRYKTLAEALAKWDKEAAL